MDKISIIVPVFNVEKYLSKCIESLVKQTYKNIEILLINDGSQDNSLNICKEWEKKDGRIKVFSQRNQGLSEARNTGIKNAKGNYICFVDSDDLVLSDFIEILYYLIKKYGCEIAQVNFIEKTDDEIEKKINIEKQIFNEKILRSRDMIKGLTTNDHKKNVIVCNKIYKKELFENLSFKNGKIYEDEFFTWKVFMKCKKIAVSDKILYVYRIRKNSIMNLQRKKISIKNLDYLEALEERMETFKNIRDMELYNLTLINYCYRLILYYNKFDGKNSENKKIKIELKNKYKKNLGKMLKSKELKLISKLFAIAILIFPNLYNIKKRDI